MTYAWVGVMEANGLGDPLGLRCIQRQDTPVLGLGFPDGLAPHDGRRLNRYLPPVK